MSRVLIRLYSLNRPMFLGTFGQIFAWADQTNLQSLISPLQLIAVGVILHLAIVAAAMFSVALS